MRNRFTALSALFAILPVGANAAGVFAQADPTSTAAVGLELVGLTIVGFATLASLAPLVAAIWIATHRRGQHRPHR